jgi:uncharacterized membrane protein
MLIIFVGVVLLFAGAIYETIGFFKIPNEFVLTRR